MRGPPLLGVNLVLTPIIAETVRREQRGLLYYQNAGEGPGLLRRFFESIGFIKRKGFNGSSGL